uniref:alanine--glyoxylate transaminase n=1 Tax=Attheya septentrionalis TaxID=420275 RepID=A0A7S2UBE1_9STRA|mmetsp:Transcript_18416/g.33357  ORF Transcript_18416/g.33357 Transcript_18416/m.33357 type:complete len:369 (+) Transcript_18416:114-1220(+)|eukprot:CAMPEP_0198284294 /NCGR_PEP_ID=MMETSP1449-20131203/3780_1 /TAXON_ID=420275 /ORGANISM="Attheya septentrionalis, Strain CCMP2084" /LENGTH=368 /DNA_ID=CAMNT_0043981293 /DNA_START=113 /DNA_END=1219 /DNA_ORIENTATION=+
MRHIPMYHLVPGPTKVSPLVLNAFVENLASSDTEDEFWDDYIGLQNALQKILHTSNDIAIMSGEGMVILWGAIKSVLRPGDKVVSVVNGLYGEGFAQMAEGMGATVHRVEFPWDGAVNNSEVIKVIKEVNPRLVTMVHCETPTGCLNDLSGVGPATTECGGLFLVDFVSSAGGVHLNVDAEQIDIGLLGSQKVISAPPALAFATVSPRAWDVISVVKYSGYDAFLPFKDTGRGTGKLLPYTHNWHAIVATRIACEQLIGEGGEAVQERHMVARDVCLSSGKDMNLRLYNAESPSPTVTAFYVPDDIEWSVLDKALRVKGVVVGGSYGNLNGKVFRIGHMGTQASKELIQEAMSVLSETLAEIRSSKSV